MMNSSLFNPASAESSHTQAPNFHNMIAPSSSFNNVGRDQYNITGVTHIYQGTAPPSTHSASTPQPIQAPFNDAPVDNLSIHFTGRKRELALIAKAFERRREIPLRCALHGNQGVGKSQLTYSWAKSTFACKENAYIMWISATTVEKLFQGFSRLLRFVNHPNQSHPDEDARLEAARRWLEEIDTGNWLLVFDNVVPETLHFFRQHLPRINGQGTILFTTRTREVAVAVTSTAGERHEMIEVPLLSVEEGVELFCGHFDPGTMDPLPTKVETIVVAVGRLPLAIAHAAAFTNQSQYSLDVLLELYQSKHKIDLISWENTLSDYEHKSVAATFTSQLQDLDRHCPDASNLLRVLAFFDPESIPLEMLLTGTKAMIEKKRQPNRSRLTSSLLALIQSPIARQHAINHLQTRCLVAYHTASRSPTFRLHDLIQLVVLEHTRNSSAHRELFEFAVELVCAAFRQIENPFSPEWWPQCELLLPHLQSLTLRQGTSITAKKALLLANQSRGSYLSGRGRYVEAESLYEDIVAERRQLFGPKDTETLAVMRNLGWVYLQRGRYDIAETSFKRVLEKYKTQLGAQHRNTLKTMYYLAEVYYHQDRHDDAGTLFKQTLQSQESLFGLQDKDTLWTMNLLAEVYHSQKCYNEAESLLTRVLQARLKSLLGPEHQHNNTAASLFQQILCALEKNFGSQHRDTLIMMYSLARVYTSQDRHGDAENMLVRVLAAMERIFGLSHPYTLNTVTLLEQVYEKTGRSDEARMLKQRILPSSS